MTLQEQIKQISEENIDLRNELKKIQLIQLQAQAETYEKISSDSLTTFEVLAEIYETIASAAETAGGVLND